MENFQSIGGRTGVCFDPVVCVHVEYVSVKQNEGDVHQNLD